MEEDPIVAEVRAAREAFAAKHNYNIDAMVAALKARENEDGREQQGDRKGDQQGQLGSADREEREADHPVSGLLDREVGIT